ncbi:MAG TPA: hypothetical protein VF533_24465 [Solirubrobacteraceae bacterium]|jgi:hypothetical protein
MTPSDPFDPFDLGALRRLDEHTLERRRRLLVQNAEDGREPVIDELCRRALPIIVTEARRRAEEKSLGREQLMRAVEEAVTNLQMRLRNPQRLGPIGEVAATLAGEAVDARAPELPEAPRLVSRRPDLRPVERVPDEGEESSPPAAGRVDEASEQREDSDPINDKLNDELRGNRIKRNDPENS